MRTKNAKRLRPVPVTLGVIALAALLAFGLLAANGTQPAAAQDATCTLVPVDAEGEPTNAPALKNIAPTTKGTSGLRLLLCEASSMQATIELLGSVPGGSEEAAESTVFVYGKDVGDGAGVVFQPGTFYHVDDVTFRASNQAASAEVNALPLEKVTIGKAQTDGVGDVKAAKGTVSVSGSQLTETVVYVAYQGDSFSAPFDSNSIEGSGVLPEEEKVKHRLLATEVVQVTVRFLGSPVASVPDDYGVTLVEERDMNKHPEPRSILTAAEYDIEDLTTDDDEILVTAEVMDANGRRLKGRITYSVDYGDSAVEAGRRSYTSQPEDYDYVAMKGYNHIVKGWTDNDEAVSIKVTANFMGGTGPLVLELVDVDTASDDLENSTLDKITKKVITRKGPLNSVVIDAVCFADVSATEAQEKICGPESRPRSVFAPKQAFTILAKAQDSLGTSLTSLPLSVKYPDEAKTEAGLNGFTGGPNFAGGKLDVTIDEKAPPGQYVLTVKSSDRTDDGRVDKEDTVTVIVSGEPTTYEIACDDYIALASFSSGECVVTAKDAEGNPPVFDLAKKQNEVTVELESTLNVRTNLPANGIVMLKEDGTGKFTVSKPADAEQGDSVAIGIRVGGDLKDSVTVMFGDDPGTTPEPMPEGEMMDEASNVIASSFPDSGTVGATWIPAEGADQHVVVLFSLPDYTRVDLVTLGADAAMYTFLDVPAGEYEVLVAAFTEEGGFQYGDDTADDVTVE